MARNSAKNLMPKESLKIFIEKTRPKPVSEITPMTMPAQAQAMATERVDLTPHSNALQNLPKVRRLDFLKKLTTIAISIANHAA
ncbi:hypothetical protein SDC9_203127 [bioreactor metagenome]|uniref:Uncharacterized protein n=1 Tax=bioreactor metagenome TaxID=1076179 RepID=A0A645IVJ3_9ZZZZ